MKALARAVSKHRSIGVAATGILVAHGSIRIARGQLLMLALSSLCRFCTINDPEGTTTREAYDLLEEGFGPRANEPLILIIELPQSANLMEMQAVSGTLQQVEGVTQVSPGIPNDPQQPTAVLWRVIPATSPQDQATTDLLHTVRSDVVPPTNEAVGTDILITGPAGRKRLLL
jgi:hypothetical protein